MALSYIRFHDTAASCGERQARMEGMKKLVMAAEEPGVVVPTSALTGPHWDGSSALTQTCQVADRRYPDDLGDLDVRWLRDDADGGRGGFRHCDGSVGKFCVSKEFCGKIQ